MDRPYLQSIVIGEDAFPTWSPNECQVLSTCFISDTNLIPTSTRLGTVNTRPSVPDGLSLDSIAPIILSALSQVVAMKKEPLGPTLSGASTVNQGGGYQGRHTAALGFLSPKYRRRTYSCPRRSA